MLKHLQSVVCILALIAAAVSPARADSAITSRLEKAAALYEAAAYEEALALLDPLDPAQSGGVAEAQRLRRYRALCLIALDRAADAARVVEDMVRADPTMPLDDAFPPRLRATLAEIRPQIARQLVREGYDSGKARFGRAEYTAAAHEFEAIIRLFDDPSLGLVADPALADIRTLADGFLALALAANRPREPTSVSAQPAAAATSPVAASAASPRVPDSNRRMVPPRPIAEKVPPVPPGVMAGYMPRREGEIEVSIAADGSVDSVRIIMAIHPTYDAILLDAARSWRYEPALQDGVPVAIKKRVRVQVEVR